MSALVVPASTRSLLTRRLNHSPICELETGLVSSVCCHSAVAARSCLRLKCFVSACLVRVVFSQFYFLSIMFSLSLTSLFCLSRLRFLDLAYRMGHMVLSFLSCVFVVCVERMFLCFQGTCGVRKVLDLMMCASV